MDLTRIAVDLMELLGGPGIALVIAAEALFPPIPGEVLLPFTGVAAARHGQHVLVPIAWTTLGSVVGGFGVYAVGRALGLQRTRALIARLPLLEIHDVDVAVRFFQRYGFPAVLLARFVPMVRTFISIPAGIEAMPLRWFLPLTLAGSLLWNSAFILAGYQLGENWHIVERYAELLQWLVIVGATVLVGWFVVRKVRGSRDRGNAPEVRR